MKDHQTTSPHGPARSNAQRTAIILAVAFQIGSTFLPQLGLGDPIGDRSDSVRTLITPAGWAFAIWGPLFSGSALFAIYQALPAQKRNELIGRIGWFAALGLAGNGLWATYTQFANLTAISALIISINLFGFLMCFRAFVTLERPFSTGERWLVVLPLSALAAWLSAATIVNISASLKYHGVGTDWDGATVTALIVLVGGVIASLALWRSRGNPAYAIVFLWALFAIYSAGGQKADIIAYAAIASGILVLAAAVVELASAENRRHWFD